jgi:hypothetical protein
MHPKITIAAIIGAILIIGAGNSVSAYAAPTDNACSLLTPAQVSAVLGISAGAGQPLGLNIPGRPAPTVSKVCGWNVAGSTTPSEKRVVLTIITVRSFTVGKTPFKGITKEPVGGVGDDAYFVTTPGFGTGLDVLKGNSALQIRVYGFSLDQIKAMEKTLAQDALARL